MNIPLKAIYYFAATARLGSYSEAAKTLHVSHGAVLAQVQKLEGWLNVKLFTRHKGRIYLNEDGQRFAERIAPALQILEQAIGETRQGQQHKIIISTTPSLAAHFLLPHIHEFHHAYPDADLELHYYLDGQYHPDSHLVLGYHNQGLPPQDNVYLLFSGASVPVCGKQYLPENSPHQLSPNDIARHTLLHDHAKTAWQHWFASHSNAPEHQHFVGKGTVYSDFNLLYTAVLRNNGIALCPHVLLHEEIAAGLLLTLSAHKGDLNRCYYLAVPQPDLLPAQQAMLDWLLQLAAQRRQAAAQQA